MKYIVTLLLVAVTLAATAQKGQTQTVHGIIMDKASEAPLVGANIVLVGSNPPLGTATNEKGYYELQGVPVGRRTFVVSYLGYNTGTMSEVLVESGKEVILDISLEEKVNNIKEVTISDNKKERPINEFSTVSARSFSMEEVTRYSGGRNDVGRLVSNFAGVSTSSDSRNDIIVRGNSPSGVLWMLEGVPIPNPNHFSTLGTTGGPVSALNTNLIRNSDFMTGAFPAQYGNANSSVFDVGFRSGNKQKHEFLFELDLFSGFELMAEGPLSKKKGGSYIVSYRYSFAGIGAALGLPIGTKSTPQYQDLNFKIDLPDTKKAGHFSIFGLGAYSFINFLAKNFSSTDLFALPDQDTYPKSGTGILGVKHTINIGTKAYVRTTLAGTATASLYDQYNYLDSVTRQYTVNDKDMTYTVRLNSYYNEKFNSKLNFRAGATAEMYYLSSKLLTRDGYPDWVSVRDYKGTMALLQPYAQAQYKFNDKLTLTGGLHSQVLTLNGRWSLEPRAALAYYFLPGQSLTLAYGLHSQMQPLPVYFYKGRNADGSYDDSNQKLDFTRSHHIVLAYDVKFAHDWRIKVEPYIQFITGAPVSGTAPTFSELNSGANFVFPDQGFLTNTGVGRNMGVELTLEKFFSKGYYGLFTTSIFDSKYKGYDGVWRNTAFNNHYVFNLLAGKEFKVGKKKRNVVTTDFKFSTSGGKWYSPIDTTASRAAGKEVRDETQAYSKQYSPYLRLDVKVGYRFNANKKKVSHSFYLDFQNVTFQQNVFVEQYNKVTNSINTIYQIGFFPDVMYKIQF